MAEMHRKVGSTAALAKPQLDAILVRLQEKGYQTLGPRIRDEAVVFAPIQTMADLPQGLTSKEEPGTYRIVPSGNKRYFDITPGAQSWKQVFFPARVPLMDLQKNAAWEVKRADIPAGRFALIGARPCDIAAIKVQDLAFIRDDFTDPLYAERRKNALIVAANCMHPGGTCFCASMGTGPRSHDGFDLALTELDDIFLVEIGTNAGLEILEEIPLQAPDAASVKKAQEGLDAAVQHMGRQLDTSDLPEVILKNLEHPEWAAVAKRCMSCTSCTQVCPTCFCWDAQDRSAVTGCESARERVWDSCFNPGYSALAGGGNSRPNTRARYRQWLSHKFGTWKEQYGVFGCVGCGRCITWCPVKIDITEEIAALRKEVRS
jgi:sulfhydrogenase subunit beta (sulfur reductase)